MHLVMQENLRGMLSELVYGDIQSHGETEQMMENYGKDKKVILLGLAYQTV